METETNFLSDEELPSDKLLFIPLGGATEIGMNCFAYGYQGKWIVVDCGVGFPGDGLPGVDVLLPDIQFLAKHKKDILALIITHGHEDHLGAVAYLWHDLQCPVYATSFSAELLEGKLAEQGLLGRAQVNRIQQGDGIELSPFYIELINMSHSIPQANGLIIKAGGETVLHTGDWKLDADPVLNQETDIARLKELKKEGVSALVCDSTNVFGEKASLNEEDVRQNLTTLIAKYPDKQIAVGCFASNVSRVKSIYEAAKANHKEVCLMGRSLWRIDAAARICGYFDDIPEFLSEQEALEKPIGQVLYICTGSQGEPYSALNTLSALSPQKNSVFFGPDDVVIFSSRIIPGNEKAIALLQKRFKTKGVEIITNKDADIHVSGHFSGPDLEKMYQFVAPKISLPVHGEARELTEHTRLAKKWGCDHAFALEDGAVFVIDKKEPRILGMIETGILAVDGKKILPLGAEVIRKRRKMIEDGTLVVTLVLSATGVLLSAPQLSTFGLLESDGEDEKQLKANISTQVQELDQDALMRDDLVENAVRSAVRKFLKEYYGKKPLIEVHLVRI